MKEYSSTKKITLCYASPNTFRDKKDEQHFDTRIIKFANKKIPLKAGLKILFIFY